MSGRRSRERRQRVPSGEIVPKTGPTGVGSEQAILTALALCMEWFKQNAPTATVRLIGMEGQKPSEPVVIALVPSGLKAIEDYQKETGRKP